MDQSSVLIGILSLFVLIALNAFFVFAEYSLAVSRRTRMAELAAQGDAGAHIVLRVMEDPDRFFAATQVGITLTSVAVGVVSEPAFRDLFQGLFEGLLGAGAADPAGFSGVFGGLLGLLVASYLQIVLAELVPRSITLRSAERIALMVVRPMNVLAGLLRPVIWLLKGSSRLVLRTLGFKAGASDQRLYSVDELRMLVDASEKGGLIESDQRDMIENVFTFGDITVREVMVPRTELLAVDADATLDDVARLLAEHPLSRLPVYAGSLDDIVGVLHSKDMMRAMIPGATAMSIRQLMREPFFVPDTQRADELLRQFRRHRQYMAIVLDEYGGTAGVVTLDDLMSEIVGELDDAPSAATPDIQPLPDGGALVNGLTSLNTANETLGLALSDDHFETVGGFMMSRLGRIPKAGDEVTLASGARLRVEEMDRLRVAKVRLIAASNPSPQI